MYEYEKEALEVLKNRRSIRKFKSNQVSKEELDLVLEAGTYAPTSKGSQEPIIIAVQDEDTVSQLDALNARILNIEKNTSSLLWCTYYFTYSCSRRCTYSS